MARVLITGGTGFIGSHLARDCLARGDEVTVLARPGSDPWRLGDLVGRITLARAHPLDVPAVAAAVARARPQRVFHLAARTRSPARDDLSDLDEAVTANVAPLQVLLDALRQLADPPALVRTGSLAEMGEADRVLDPQEAERPGDAYGLSALMGTQVLRLARARLGLAAVTARLCLTYGGDQSPDFLVPGLIRRALSGLPLQVRRPQAQRDLIHVRDCVAALRLAADHAAALPPIVTVATGQPLPAGHLAESIAALTRVPDGSIPATPPVPALAAHVLSCRPSPEITALGWHPRVGLARGLRETINWERARIMPPQECLA